MLDSWCCITWDSDSVSVAQLCSCFNVHTYTGTQCISMKHTSKPGSMVFFISCCVISVTEAKDLGEPVMTRSRLGPEPVPVPAQPRTDPPHFIADAPRVASRHMTHSHHVHPQTRASASWYARPLVVHVVFLPAI